MVKEHQNKGPNDDYGYACDCGCVRFNLLKSGKTECDNCGKSEFRWTNQSAKLDVHVLLDAVASAAKGEPFDPDFIPTIEAIAKSWDAKDFTEEDVKALYDCGPKTLNN